MSKQEQITNRECQIDQISDDETLKVQDPKSLQETSQLAKQQVSFSDNFSAASQENKINQLQQTNRIPVTYVPVQTFSAPTRVIQSKSPYMQHYQDGIPNQVYNGTNLIVTKDPTITKEFDNIVRTDFSRFVSHRKCLNVSNLYLIYIFYLFQTAGILTTTLSVSIFQKQFVWIGIVLNSLASLIHIYQEVNNKISYKLQRDLIAILQNKYILETQLVDAPLDLQPQSQQKQSHKDTL